MFRYLVFFGLLAATMALSILPPSVDYPYNNPWYGYHGGYPGWYSPSYAVGQGYAVGPGAYAVGLAGVR